MRRKNVKLRSIYYDEEDIQELVDILVDDSVDPDVSIQVQDEEGVREFRNLEDFFSNPFIPNNVVDFTLQIHTLRGYAQIMADGEKNKHRLYLKGDDEWVSGMENNITTFTKRNEVSRIRSLFSYWARISLISIGIGLLIGTQLKYVIHLFGIPIFYTYTLNDAMFLVISLSVISVGFFAPKVWPYVAIQTEKPNPPGYRKSISRAVMIISSLLGIVTALIQIANWIR